MIFTAVQHGSVESSTRGVKKIHSISDYFVFCNKLRNQRVAASQEKKLLPWTASCGKIQANVFKLERRVCDKKPSSVRHTLVANLARCESQTLAIINFPGKITESLKSCIDLKNVL